MIDLTKSVTVSRAAMRIELLIPLAQAIRDYWPATITDQELIRLQLGGGSKVPPLPLTLFEEHNL